jgi:hypothetical protein
MGYEAAYEAVAYGMLVLYWVLVLYCLLIRRTSLFPKNTLKANPAAQIERTHSSQNYQVVLRAENTSSPDFVRADSTPAKLPTKLMWGASRYSLFSGDQSLVEEDGWSPEGFDAAKE